MFANFANSRAPPIRNHQNFEKWDVSLWDSMITGKHGRKNMFSEASIEKTLNFTDFKETHVGCWKKKQLGMTMKLRISILAKEFIISF